jgi:hypothetical protein
MNVERLVLSQKQLAEEVAPKEDTTLYTDETSKFRSKYSGCHISNSEGRYYVCLNVCMLRVYVQATKMAPKEDTTLYTDETSKFGSKFGLKYSGYRISDSGGQFYVLGMRNLATTWASNTMKGLQQILQDIND